MFLGIPLFLALLILFGPFLAVAPSALAAALSWPSSPRRSARLAVAFRAPQMAGA